MLTTETPKTTRSATLIEAAIRDYRKRGRQMVEPDLSRCEVVKIRKATYAVLRSRSETLMVYEVLPGVQYSGHLRSQRPTPFRLAAHPELATGIAQRDVHGDR